MRFGDWWTERQKKHALVLHVKALGLIVDNDDENGPCCYCGGRTHGICTTFTRTAPSGEAFRFRTHPFAFLCPRCQAVATSSDMSCDTMHVDQATDTLMLRAAKARAERERPRLP
jgi:hypothetical protein